MEPYADVVGSYRDFASYAGSDSPTFCDWAAEVAEDGELVAWIAGLPDTKQQPNLVFAAARWHGVTAPGPFAGLRDALLGDNGTIRSTILARATQTNEVGRLATLVPAFGQFSGPLALIEVGASAGLCLYPDRWGYSWSTPTGEVRLGHAPRLPCRVTGPAPLPTELPTVTWRAGVDLNPLHVDDCDQMAWLEQLVWPEQAERRATLGHAVEIARREPAELVAGDLLHELPALVERASALGTVVVFHSAVIAYLRPDDRSTFDATMRALVGDRRCHWVSNEGKTVLPSVAETGPDIAEAEQTFVLGVDGQMVAKTHGHGRSLSWTSQP